MKHNRVVAQLRLLRGELALRCYQSKHGRPPEKLEQLVPKYLEHVPQDPFTKASLVYRPQGPNWLLYSRGEDRADNGGTRVGKSKDSLIGLEPSTSLPQGDLFYDSPP